MNNNVTREAAWELLKKYNKDPFHQHHAVTVEGVMRYFAKELGYEEDVDFWGLCGLLHDIDFEMWPEEHCRKAPELLAEIDAPEELVHAVCSHGYGLCCDVEPVHQMEKILFATDELTGIVGAAIILRPSHSCQDMDLKSLRKKFKDKRFAGGCSRDVIAQGAEYLGWELDELMQRTLDAMKSMPDPTDLDAENGIVFE
ncbi:MAG: hydrolase [Clostridiales bacterium]|nr:hydrolase [Candidatus Crickella caballi]